MRGALSPAPSAQDPGPRQLTLRDAPSSPAEPDCRPPRGGLHPEPRAHWSGRARDPPEAPPTAGGPAHPPPQRAGPGWGATSRPHGWGWGSRSGLGAEGGGRRGARGAGGAGAAPAAGVGAPPRARPGEAALPAPRSAPSRPPLAASSAGTRRPAASQPPPGPGAASGDTAWLFLPSVSPAARGGRVPRGPSLGWRRGGVGAP